MVTAVVHKHKDLQVYSVINIVILEVFLPPPTWPRREVYLRCCVSLNITCYEQISTKGSYFLFQWEAKPSRMMLMTLTDGEVEVKGMEYKPIPALSPDTTPGTKVGDSIIYMCVY